MDNVNADCSELDCPVDNLPSELLSLVFDNFTSARAEKDDEPACAALILYQVCHRWREALTASHWSTIRVRHPKHQRTLRHIISRSEGHKLDISIRLRDVEADYFSAKDISMAKEQWRVIALFNTLADHQSRLDSLTVEARQAVLAWFEQVIIRRPLTVKHLSLIQIDKDLHMHNFAQSCFNIDSCVTLCLTHTSIIVRYGDGWPSLRELRLFDIRAFELMGWTYDKEVDDHGGYRWQSKSPRTRFESVELLSVTNTFFLRREFQVCDFLSLFPNVRELELDCIDSDLILDVLDNDLQLLPRLRRLTVAGVEVKCLSVATK